VADNVKAFDSVLRRGLWQTMCGEEVCGRQCKGLDKVWRRGLWQTVRGEEVCGRQCTREQKAQLESAKMVSEVSNWFETMVGVLQGCVLSPLLFNVTLEVVMAL